MPDTWHRSRASSTSFSGNCRAKFGRKLKNLSETTADDTDNADEETPGSAPVSELDLLLNFRRHARNYYGAVDARFSKRGSFRSGSNIGSSRSEEHTSEIFSASAPTAWCREKSL